jgi:predicted LPLAT superfamily acyltransferase
MALIPDTGAPPRNPGPSWGYHFLRLADRVLPEPLFRRLRAAGTWAAVGAMPLQRRFSKEYLRIVLAREPAPGDVFRHFFSVCEALTLRLRVANGRPHRCVLGPGAEDFARWLSSGRPALLGTFHIGNSDLTGFMLAGQEHRRVRIVRLRVANSHDTEALAERFGDRVRFVWVNEPGGLLLALKEACASADAVALQCDRPDHSSRSEPFEFLGASRAFPFAIYHLSLIFGRPVILSFGAPDGPGQSVVHGSPIFEPREGEPRDAALARAREHFQAFLRRVEAHLRSNPYQWLNFHPL